MPLGINSRMFKIKCLLGLGLKALGSEIPRVINIYIIRETSYSLAIPDREATKREWAAQMKDHRLCQSKKM